METILKYFPQLTEEQQRQLAALHGLYTDWNSKINVISRKDIGHLYEHHVLHSLAILFPEARFTLIDSIGKKIKVATEVVNAIGLHNVTLKHLRVEEEKGKYHFVVSRAVMPLDELVRLVRKNIATRQQNALPNGLICLKGGELQREIAPFGKSAELTDISDFFQEEYFKTKKIVYLPM